MREYLYVITIQWTHPDGRSILTCRDGTVDVTGTVSRRAVFEDIVRQTREGNDVQGSHVVLFFSLEPSELAA